MEAQRLEDKTAVYRNTVPNVIAFRRKILII